MLSQFSAGIWVRIILLHTLEFKFLWGMFSGLPDLHVYVNHFLVPWWIVVIFHDHWLSRSLLKYNDHSTIFFSIAYQLRRSVRQLGIFVQINTDRVKHLLPVLSPNIRVTSGTFDFGVGSG